jgi:hypothetical protein
MLEMHLYLAELERIGQVSQASLWYERRLYFSSSGLGRSTRELAGLCDGIALNDQVRFAKCVDD